MSLLLFLMPDLFRSKINQIKLLFSKCSVSRSLFLYTVLKYTELLLNFRVEFRTQINSI